MKTASRKSLLNFLLLSLIFISPNCKDTLVGPEIDSNNEMEVFKDSNLRAAIYDQIINNRPDSTFELASFEFISKKDFERIQHLEIFNKNIKVLDGLENCINLKTIHLGNNPVTNLEPLSTLEQLYSINLSHCDVEDLTPLEDLQQLQTVSLSQCKIRDISPLNNLQSLRMIEAGYNFIESIDFIKPMPELVYLSLPSCGTTSIKGDFINSKIEQLNLWDNNLQDISFIADLKSIKLLWLGDNKNISDFSPLNNLKNLEYIDLRNVGISDIGFVKNYTHLDNIDISGNRIDDISPLSYLENLTVLQIRSINIDDISIIENFPNLRMLSASNNRIKDISILSKMSNLNTVELRNNSIEDLLSIVNCGGMQGSSFLDISNNPLSDKAINEQIPILESRGVYVHR